MTTGIERRNRAQQVDPPRKAVGKKINRFTTEAAA